MVTINEKLFSKFKQIYKNHLTKDLLNLFNEKDLDNFLLDRWNFINNKKQYIHIQCKYCENAWPFYASIIEINLKDIPFIVDTVLDYLKSQKYTIFRVINVILYIKRNKKLIEDISEKENKDYTKESYIYIELEKLNKEELINIQKVLLNNLKELNLMVYDFNNIKKQIINIPFINPELNKEKQWILENFIQMGYIHLENTNKTFGILKLENYKKLLLEEISSVDYKTKLREYILYKESIIKSNVKIYKPLHLIIFIYNNEKHILIGSYASKGEIAPRFLIPHIKEKLDKIALRINAPIGGFKYKEIYKISQLIPIGILITRDIDIIQSWIEFFINNLYTDEQKIHISTDKNYNGLWINIIELIKYADINYKIKDILANYNIEIITHFSRNYNQFLYTFLFVKSKQKNLKLLKKFIEKKQNEIFYSWFDEFRKVINYKENTIQKIKYKVEFYKKIIPPSFPNYITPKEAYNNLQFLETIDKNKKYFVKFSRSISLENNQEVTTINIYTHYKTTLTDIFPILDSVGLKIKSEIPFEFFLNSEKKYLIILYFDNNFPLEWMEKIRIGIEELLNNKHTIEKINQLLITTKLTIREISFIKTIIAYYFQINKQFSRLFLQDFFIKYPEFSEMIMDYIYAIFNTDGKLSQKREQIDNLKKFINTLKIISEQTLGLNILEVIQNIVRTNFFLNLEEIAIKVFTKEISYMQVPMPLFEIFVYSKDLEGIHIRNDYISRGGIRWSDRIDDFRYEIYELMKTQIIKNTVIVPDGAKGGYIIKKNLSSLTKEEKIKLSELFYKKYITNLLTLTDNYSKDNKIEPIYKIVRLDSDDPYLVVAADKGTATFSDIANEISINHNYWLKDAFASGGSNGYDHKKQGITAKGAWESVKKHFSELNIDPEKDKITVIGIGDMSGDVFGNGMILSKTIQLIAAFNHIHIFIDPNPDPEISFQERLRLFKEAKGWDQYNTKLISKGGGVFERNSAQINLSEEIKYRFQINKNIISGDELIQYILKAKADLLWNGGIGTYIKSSIETHNEIKDPANDNVRIDAKDLNVKVIGEGGNLGLTMKARIEAYKKGILVNTDFIDNAGGVSMSDHEVNFKIFLNVLERNKIIHSNKRNYLIRKYENNMINKVLENIKFNNLGISLEKYRLLLYPYLLEEWIEFLTKENLIKNSELNKRNLTGPEICLISGYTKLYFKKYFKSFDLKFNNNLLLYLLSMYFPEEIIIKYKDYVLDHPLKKEIIQTLIVNDIINNLGILHFFIFNKTLNLDFITILNKYVYIKYFYHIHSFYLYKNFFDIPKNLLYEYLIEFSYYYSLFYFFIDDIQLLENEKNKLQFHSNLNKLYKLLLTKNDIQVPITEKYALSIKKLDSLSRSLLITMIHHFLMINIDVLKFYNLFNENLFIQLFYKIKDVNISTEQELKFQYRLLQMYFSLIKKIFEKQNKDRFYESKKILEKFLKKDIELKLIDLFEIINVLESSFK